MDDVFERLVLNAVPELRNARKDPITSPGFGSGVGFGVGV